MEEMRQRFDEIIDFFYNKKKNKFAEKIKELFN